MKNYYQQKKGGWKLDPAIYARTVSQIRCYRIYQRQAGLEAGIETEIETGAGTEAEAEAGTGIEEKAMTVSPAASHEHAKAGQGLPAISCTNSDTKDVADPRQNTARRYVRIIDQALLDYVPESYRAAVFSHVVDRMTYNDLEEQYFISASTLKRYTQVFIWGVAKGLGDVGEGADGNS